MKSRLVLLFLAILAEGGLAQTAGGKGCYEHFREAGEAAVNRRRPNFELARKKFSAAKECPEASAEQRRLMDERIRDVEAKNLNALEKQIDVAEASQALAEARAEEADRAREEAAQALVKTKAAYEEAEKRRIESEAATRHALANDLAFRAQTALRDGDRTTAFRLAEFAWKFVEPGNLRARQAIVDVFYQNDKTSDRCPLPWRTHNFAFDDGDAADRAQFSADGKLFAASTAQGSVFVWELATGRELFFLPKQSAYGRVAFSADCKRVAVCRREDELAVFNVPNDAPPLRIGCTGSGTLLNLLFSPDGGKLSAVADDGGLVVFSTKTGTAISKQDGQGGQHLLATSLSSDQKTILFIHDDGQIEVIDAERGERMSAFSIGSPYPLAVGFSMDGKKVAVSCADRSLGIWRAADGVKLLAFAPQTLAATSLYFSNDGKTLTTTYANNDAKNWDTSTGTEIKIDRENIGDTYYDLQISPDGQLKCVYSFDRGLEVFDNASGKKLFAKPLADVGYNYGFSPDSRLIMLTRADGSAELLDSGTGKLRFSIPIGDEMISHQFSPDGRRIAFSRGKGSIDIWELSAEKEIFPKEGRNWRGEALFSPDSRLVAMPLTEDSLKILDAATGETRFAWGGRGPECLFLDKNRLMTWGAGGQFFINDLSTGEIVAQSPLDAPDGNIYPTLIDGGKLIAARSNVTGLLEVFDAATGREIPTRPNCLNYMVSPDGKWALERSADDSMAHVTDRATGREAGAFAVGPPEMYLISGFSPDGQRLLCIDYEKNVGLILGMPSGKLLIELRDESMTVNRLTWAAGGKKVNTGDPFFSQWDAETGKLEVSTYFSANRFAFSKDGDRAVSISSNREATLWDVGNARPLFTLRGHTKDIQDQVFTEKADKVLTTASDQTARLWDVATGREVLRLQADTFEMGAAQLSPDGRLAAIFQRDRADIWHLDADTILSILAKNNQFAPLSPEQIYDFNIEEPLRAPDIFEKALLRLSAAECHELARFYLGQGIVQYDIGLFQTSFSRAERLFQKAANESDRPSITLELIDLYAQWSKKLVDNGLAAEARPLAARVERLTASAGELDAKSMLQLAFAQTAVGRAGEANNIYKKLADQNQNLNEVKQALDESTRLFGKSKEAQPILEQLKKSIEAEDKGGANDPAEGEKYRQQVIDPAAPVAENDWPAQLAKTREDLKTALRANLNYSYDGSIRDVTNLMGNLSFYLIFDKKFDEARRTAELGLMVDTAQVFIKTNLGHAFMFKGQTERAREIYASLVDVPDPDSNPPRTFRATLLKDFELFSDAGLRSRDLPKMVEFVSGQKLGAKERAKYLPQ